MPAYDASRFNPPAPVAMVTLRNQDNETTLDVPMLLDSGADVTLVAQSSIERLGLAVDPRESYELMSFDGTTSSAQVVRLDLIFLRRVFRGRFLMTFQEYGILGRDILNHISLLLDGPGLTWGEKRRVEQ